MMEYCIFCNKNTPCGSVEHIFPSALGGILTSDSLLCNKHNSMLGTEVDAPFIRQYDIVRSLFEIYGADNQIPPILRNYEAKNGKYYDLLPGGIPTLHKPEYRKDKKGIQAKYRTEAEARKRLKEILRKYPNGELTAENIQTTVGTLGKGITIGGADLFRGIAKIAYEYFAHNFGNECARSTEFEQLRKYILEGGELLDQFTYYYFFDLPSKANSSRFPVHSIYLHHEGANLPLVVLFKIFGIFTFQACLHPNWKGRAGCYLYQVDPIKKTDRSFELPIDEFNYNLKWLRESETIFKQGQAFSIFKKWFEELFQLYFDHSRDIMINKTLEEVLGPPDGRILTKEDVDKLATTLANRFIIPMHPGGVEIGRRSFDAALPVVQTINPKTGHYIKIDRSKGGLITHKKSPGPYKGIPIIRDDKK